MFHNLLKSIPFFSPSANSLPPTDPNSAYKLTYTAAEKKAAYAAVKEIGHHRYELEGIDGDDVLLHFYGCAGNASEEQKAVAALREKAAREKKPLLIFGTGDHFYNDGVPAVDDPAFLSHYFFIECDPALSTLIHIPYFAALGNHDGNYWKGAGSIDVRQKMHDGILGSIGSVFYPRQGHEVEVHQMARTFLDKPEEALALYKIANYDPDRLQQKKLDFPTLVNHKIKWNLPSDYYSLVIGKVEFIVANSNSFVKDYYELTRNNPQNGMNNQARWLDAVYKTAKAEGRKVHLVQHHPLFTIDKRVYAGDENLYLPDINMRNSLRDEFIDYLKHKVIRAEQKRVKHSDSTFKLSPEEITERAKKTIFNYNEMLQQIHEKQGHDFDLVFVAHHHALSYYNNINSRHRSAVQRQVLIGGGGGPTHAREDYSQRKSVGYFRKMHGFATLAFNKNDPVEFKISFHTTDGDYVTFTDKDSQAIRTISTDPHVETLMKLTLDACNQYLKFIQLNQCKTNGKFFSNNVTHKMIDIDKIDQIMAYLKKPEPSTYDDLVFFILDKTLSLNNNDSVNSFPVKLLSELKNHLIACIENNNLAGFKTFQTTLSMFMQALPKPNVKQIESQALQKLNSDLLEAIDNHLKRKDIDLSQDDIDFLNNTKESLETPDQTMMYRFVQTGLFT